MRRFCLTILIAALFFAPDAFAQQGKHEIGASYGSVFFSDGDVTGRSFELSATRYAFTTWTGMSARLGYQRAVSDDLRAAAFGLHAWKKKHNYFIHAALFADLVRFETGAVEHHLRLKAGPSVQVRRGEDPLELFHPAAFEWMSPEDLERFEQHLEEVRQRADRYVYDGHLSGRDLRQEGRRANHRRPP